MQRMVNLMGAWHSQLLEVMGAMGIRESAPAARRNRQSYLLRRNRQ